MLSTSGSAAQIEAIQKARVDAGWKLLLADAAAFPGKMIIRPEKHDVRRS